jgi:hypothetical protein
MNDNGSVMRTTLVCVKHLEIKLSTFCYNSYLHMGNNLQ